MAVLSGFDTYYSDHPFGSITNNQRDWYVPELLEVYRTRSVYAPFVSYQVNMAGPPTTNMIFREVYDTEPDVSTLDNRDIWAPSQYIDSRSIEVSMERHGDKIALHKYDDLVTYWKENNRAGLRNICRTKLGQNMVDYLDILMRNAFGGCHFMMFSGAATGTSDLHFDHLGSTHIFDADDIMQVWLKAQMNDLPMANNPTGPQGTIVAVTTPGVIFDIQDTAASSSHWKSVQQYLNVPPISQYEVGQYKQARFLATTRNILWNAGLATGQTTLATDVTAGGGSPTPATKVRGVYGVGEADATHTIAVTSNTLLGAAAGDMISFTKLRETDNRPRWDDPAKFERMVYSVSGNNLAFEKPILRDLTASDTWYLSKGRHVHMTVFMAGPNGVVAGVGQRPEVHAPPPIDDFEAMHRFSWDAYLKYQQFRPEHVYLIFSAGSTDWG